MALVPFQGSELQKAIDKKLPTNTYQGSELQKAVEKKQAIIPRRTPSPSQSGGGYSYVDVSTGRGYEVTPTGEQVEVTPPPTQQQSLKQQLKGNTLTEQFISQTPSALPPTISRKEAGADTSFWTKLTGSIGVGWRKFFNERTAQDIYFEETKQGTTERNANRNVLIIPSKTSIDVTSGIRQYSPQKDVAQTYFITSGLSTPVGIQLEKERTRTYKEAQLELDLGFGKLQQDLLVQDAILQQRIYDKTITLEEAQATQKKNYELSGLQATALSEGVSKKYADIFSTRQEDITKSYSKKSEYYQKLSGIKETNLVPFTEAGVEIGAFIASGGKLGISMATTKIETALLTPELTTWQRTKGIGAGILDVGIGSYATIKPIFKAKKELDVFETMAKGEKLGFKFGEQRLIDLPEGVVAKGFKEFGGLRQELYVYGTAFKEGASFTAPSNKYLLQTQGVVESAWEGGLYGGKKSAYVSTEVGTISAKGLTTPLGESDEYFMSLSKVFLQPTSRTYAMQNLKETSAGFTINEKKLFKQYKSNWYSTNEVYPDYFSAMTKRVGDKGFVSASGKITDISIIPERELSFPTSYKVNIRKAYPNEPTVSKANIEPTVKGGTTYGFFTPFENKITLKKGLRGLQLKETYLHERYHFDFKKDISIKGVTNKGWEKMSNELTNIYFPKLRRLGYPKYQVPEEMSVRIMTDVELQRQQLKISKGYASSKIEKGLKEVGLVKTSKVLPKIYASKEFSYLPPKPVMKAQMAGKIYANFPVKLGFKQEASAKISASLKDITFTKLISRESIKGRNVFEVMPSKGGSLVSAQSFKTTPPQGLISEAVIKSAFQEYKSNVVVLKPTTRSSFVSPSFLGTSGRRGGQVTTTVQRQRFNPTSLSTSNLGVTTKNQYVTKFANPLSTKQISGYGQRLKSNQMQSPSLASSQLTGTSFKFGELTGLKQTQLNPPSLSPPIPLGGFGGGGFFGGGFSIPELGSGLGVVKPKRKGKRKKTKILPSFTAQVFDIRGALPKAGMFGITPFQLRKVPI